MKVGIGAAVLTTILVSHQTAAAEVPTGNDLLLNCTTMIRSFESGQNAPTVDDAFLSGQCLGHINGIRTAMYYTSKTAPENIRACFPSGGIPTGQLARIVIKYLKDHPVQLDREQTLLTMMALKDAYPCK